MFQNVPSKTDFVQLERDILQFWKETDAFEALRRLRAGNTHFSFLDGPITANNPMGVHHAWGRTYKDLFQRYRAMQGIDQRWQNGFDCQGLWVEVNVEKELGFTSKRDIEEFGLAKFVLLCKQRVLTYAAIMTEQSMRLGMWMDWNHPDQLRSLRYLLGADPARVITVQGPNGPVMDTVEQIVARLGLPELGGSYYTFSNANNYDIWTFLKECADRGWIYKGTDVIPWCARCGTAISEHEISTEDYPDITHTSVTARFPLKDRENEFLLVWTTQPWTYVPNVMVAVGPELTYLQVKQGDKTYYVSEHTTHMLQGPYEVVRRLKGSEMVGWTYVGAFDELPAEQEVGGHVAPDLRAHVPHPPLSAVQAHRVVPWDGVSESEGTGIVEMGTGAGPEDFVLGKQLGLPVVAPLDENGIFMDGFGEFTGSSVFTATPRVIDALERKGMLYRVDDYTHRYPTCWRCKTELVFRLVDEWYISMGQVYDKPRDRLTPEEKARSLRYQIMDVVDQIRWIPAFGYEREMDWLRNMHDWMISKKRYWGLALPIWECENCGDFEVIGSREELERRAVKGWEIFDHHTPHRPYIDAVKIACRKCGGEVARVKDVGNPWLDAGIVPFSTMQWRTNRAYWENWFPADLVTESFPGQFRNWFYSMLAMSTVLAHRAPFKNLMGYGTLLAEDGRAMHKSLGNMIEFNEAADTIGADVMRWMFARARYESNILFGYHSADETRRTFMLPLWNVYSFFVTYARLDGWTPDRRPAQFADLGDLDRWIVSRLQQVIAEVSVALDEYDCPRAVRAVEPFIDDLSNWYLRRSRRRFWRSEPDSDKRNAYGTLYEVLVSLVKLLAPFIPFTTESMYQNLVRSVDSSALPSVHHCLYPEADRNKLDSQLMEDMATARQVVALGHGIRGSRNIKLRQPLNRVIVLSDSTARAGVERLAALIADELNVKTLETAEREEQLVTYQLRPNLPALSQRVKELVPESPDGADKIEKKQAREKRRQLTSAIQTALASLDPALVVSRVRAGRTVSLDLAITAVELGPEHILVMPQPKAGLAVGSEGNLVVALDTELTPELLREGLAREFVRRVQDLRKTAGLEVSDHIVTYYVATASLSEAIEAFRSYIGGETLSDEIIASEPPSDAAKADDSFDSEHLVLGLHKSRRDRPEGGLASF